MTAPEGLGEQGAQLWDDLTGVFDLRPDERATLAQAARTVDELERLGAELREAPATVPGSKGQPRPHPLWYEVRAHRLVLAKLLGAIDVPEAEEPQVVTNHRQQAAQARWAEYRRKRGTA